MKNHHVRLFGFSLLSCLMAAPLSAQEVLINEFMALNSKNLADEDGEYSDWVELYNTTNRDINLAKWQLTDKKGSRKEWFFPSVTISAGAYLLVWASGKDRYTPGGEIHTSFKLSGSGEYLGLCRPDGTVEHEYSPTFPAQQSNVSYGLYEGKYQFFQTPTPGQPNTMGGNLPVPDFSVAGGFHNASFNLSLSVSDPSLVVLYTLDGSRPNVRNAKRYTGPFSVSRTTPVSAVSYNPACDTLYSAVKVQTYLFISDILEQPAEPEGYPMIWSPLTDSTWYAADYAMDPAVVHDPLYEQRLPDALVDIPSVCLTTDIDNLFSQSCDADSGGIYVHTGKSRGGLGQEWERPASIEFYDYDKGQRFQLNCGLRLHGGNSRNPGNSGKHSFRVAFRGKYGASKLNYKLYPDKSAGERFDDLVLRAGYNYTWIVNGSKTLYPNKIIQRTNAQYVYDTFAKKAHRAMGGTATHGRFVHLYLNGLYWGVYDLSEKIDAKFAEEYLGGDDTEYDVVGDHNEVFDGDRQAYNEMFNLAKSVGSSLDDANYRRLVEEGYLDIDDFIDYMLVNYYVGNEDWDTNNWRCGRNKVNPGKGFRYFVWDAETVFTELKSNRVDYLGGDPTRMLAALAENPEFRIRLADRVYKHFYHGGVLSPEGAAALYREVCDEIDLAIVAESARWGDYRRLTGESDVTYTRDEHWLPRQQDLLTNYFPYRSEEVLRQLKAQGYYRPEVEAPVLSQAGGEFSDSLVLEMSCTKGYVCYTLDGSDPRTPYTGSASTSSTRYRQPLTLTEDTRIKARAYSGGQWSPIVEADYRVRISPKDAVETPLVGEISCRFDGRCLAYELPEEGEVCIAIYDASARLVAAYAPGRQGAGLYRIPCLSLTDGLYIYRLRYKGQVINGKFLK